MKYPDELMFDCIMAGHEANKEVVKFINGIVERNRQAEV